MQYRKLGSTNKKISIISAGLMRFPNPDDKEEMAKIPYEAAKNGINFFDTAPGYCDEKSESILGLAIKEMKKSGFNYYISTKTNANSYDEVFIDEGDIDIIRIFKILKENEFQGVIIPDHTPLMSCSAPWHAGMAYTMGYLQAALKAVS